MNWSATVLRLNTPPGCGSSVAATPIQRTSFSGSVKNGNTVSGPASILISRSTTLFSLCGSGNAAPPLLVLGGALEPLEPVFPEAVEKRSQLGEALRPHAI